MFRRRSVRRRIVGSNLPERHRVADASSGSHLHQVIAHRLTEQNARPAVGGSGVPLRSDDG